MPTSTGPKCVACPFLREVNRPMDRWVFKILLPRFLIQSKVLTDFQIQQLQQIVDSSSVWARILDFAYNEDIFARILDSRQNFNGGLVNKFRIIMDQQIFFYPYSPPSFFSLPSQCQPLPPPPSPSYQHKLTHMPNYIMGISLGQSWLYISYDACKQALPGVGGDKMRKGTLREILTFPVSPSPNPRSPRKACLQAKWANREIICPSFSSGVLSIVLSRRVIMCLPFLIQIHLTRQL